MNYDYDIEERFEKIKEAFSKVKYDINNIGNNTLNNKKSIIDLEKKVEKINKDLIKINGLIEDFEQISNGSLILDKIKFLTKKQKIQEKEINKLKKEILEINSNTQSNPKNQQINKNTEKQRTIIPMKNEEFKIVGNKTSKKVHYSHCIYAQNIKKHNYIEFNTVQEGVKQGYSKCICIFDQ